jgi:hypothetical protein
VQNRLGRPLYVVGLLSLVLIAGSCKGDMGPAGPAGATGPTGATGPGGPAAVIATTVVLYSGTTTDVAPSTFKQIRTFTTFTKVSASTTVQVVWTSHVSANGGYCNFHVRVDGNASPATDYGAVIAGTDPNAYYPVSTTNVFTGLAAGSHALTLWDRGVGATSCTDNPGNYPDRRLVVTEY